MVSTTPRPVYPWELPGTPVLDVGWALGPVWTGAENLAPIGIQSPDHPARRDIAADAKVLRRFRATIVVMEKQ